MENVIVTTGHAAAAGHIALAEQVAGVQQPTGVRLCDDAAAHQRVDEGAAAGAAEKLGEVEVILGERVRQDLQRLRRDLVSDGDALGE